MRKQIISKLLELKTQYGEALFSEPKRVLAFIKDYFPFAKIEHYLLEQSLKIDVYKQLKEGNINQYMLIRNQCISQLHDTYLMDRSLAEDAVELWIRLVKKEKGIDTVFSQDKLLGEKLVEITKEENKVPSLQLTQSLSLILHMADCYYNGQGVAKNNDEAKKWYLKAAALGSEQAMITLGNMHYMGHGIKKDFKEAFKWYQKAAKLGSAVAMNYLGNMYYEGKGVEKDEKQAIYYYEKAACLGHYTAMFNLGYIYYEAHMKGWDEPFEVYLKAAQRGAIEAMNHVAYAYHMGDSVTQDYKKAMKWYKALAKKGQASAMILLSYMYLNGQGASKDYNKAAQWCEKAIKLYQ